MKRIFMCFIILFFSVVCADARVVELTLHPAKTSEEAQKYRLLPRPEEQSDSDARPLYQKAIESLPENFETDQIGQWVKTTPLDKLPRKQVQSTLQRLKKPLQLVAQATRCKRCSWADVEYYTVPKNLNEYRKVAYILALQARHQIAEHKYEQAIDTIRVGLMMAQHVSEGQVLVQGLVGIAVSALMLRPVEDLVQLPDAPNLYWALRDLPKPMVDLTEQMEREPQSANKRIQILMKRLDRDLAMLQCIEALRLYAGSHKGKFPNKLAEITQVTVPSDPINQKPFIYSRTGSNAVLESPAAKGARPEDAMRYELTLKK